MVFILKRSLNVIVILLLTYLFVSSSLLNAQQTKPRTIITTDGEVDDQDSFIRLLLYSNEFKIEGLVYSSSQWHYKGDEIGTLFTSEISNTAKRYGQRPDLRWPGTGWMQQFVDEYALVYTNLLKHDKNYPSPAYLKSIIKTGNIDFEGEMSHDTEGSDFIKQILLDNKPGPVYLQIWGGTNTVARALKSIEDQYKNTPQWNEINKKVSAKAILYTVLDQDVTYQKYVALTWPNIKVMYNSNQFWCLAYPWKQVVPVSLQETLNGKWFAKHIKFNHGSLLANYFLWGDGQKILGDAEHTQGDTAALKKNGHEQYDFISEGDSPAFLHLVNVGLGNLNDASYGGWGGRMIQSKTNPFLWDDRLNVTDYNPYTKKIDAAYPQTRWITAIQNDFAARADWCVMNYKLANHAPIIKISGGTTMKAKPGMTIQLHVSAKDPDDNPITYKWWQYEEAGTFKGKIDMQKDDKSNFTFIVPSAVKTGETIHIIVEVIDGGSPQLTRYQRIIVKIED